MLAKTILVKVCIEYLICVFKSLLTIGITKNLFYKLLGCDYWQTIFNIICDVGRQLKNFCQSYKNFDDSLLYNYMFLLLLDLLTEPGFCSI